MRLRQVQYGEKEERDCCSCWHSLWLGSDFRWVNCGGGRGKGVGKGGGGGQKQADSLERFLCGTRRDAVAAAGTHYGKHSDFRWAGK